MQICNEAVDELLDAGERGEADLVTHINFPIPIRVIAAALGIPDERKDDFKRWSNALVGRLDGQPLTEKAMADLIEMTGYFQEVVAERRADPGDDLISWLITGAEAGEEPLEPRDLVSFCTLLLIAGNETTTNLLGNSFQAFFDHPDQHEAMRRSDNLATVVEEVVRYDSPVQGILRLTNEDLTLRRRDHPQRRGGPDPFRIRRTATKPDGRTPTASTYPVNRKTTSASDRASTSASAPISPASRPKSPLTSSAPGYGP